MQVAGKNEWTRSGTLLRAAVVAGLEVLALCVAGMGQQQNATEDQVKAAYLLNFAKLAEWPVAALPDGPSPLVIGISGGEEELVDAVKAMAAGKVVGTHLLVVKTVSTEKEAESCQIVFF